MKKHLSNLDYTVHNELCENRFRSMHLQEIYDTVQKATPGTRSPKWETGVRWSLSRLKKEGLIKCTGKGTWQAV